MVSGVSDFFQISRASRSEFATRLLPGHDKPAPSLQNQLFVIPLTSSLDPQRNHKDSARDFANLLDPSGTRQAGVVVSEVCTRGYGAGRVGEGSTRGEERLVG